jgi:heat shock protein beta
MSGEDEKQKQLATEFSLLCNWMKKKMGDKISKVQVSKRLSSSPCVLVSGKDGWSANMERCLIQHCLQDNNILLA